MPYPCCCTTVKCPPLFEDKFNRSAVDDFGSDWNVVSGNWWFDIDSADGELWTDSTDAEIECTYEIPASLTGAYFSIILLFSPTHGAGFGAPVPIGSCAQIRFNGGDIVVEVENATDETQATASRTYQTRIIKAGQVVGTSNSNREPHISIDGDCLICGQLWVPFQWTSRKFSLGTGPVHGKVGFTYIVVSKHHQDDPNCPGDDPSCTPFTIRDYLSPRDFDRVQCIDGSNGVTTISVGGSVTSKVRPLDTEGNPDVIYRDDIWVYQARQALPNAMKVKFIADNGQMVCEKDFTADPIVWSGSIGGSTIQPSWLRDPRVWPNPCNPDYMRFRINQSDDAGWIGAGCFEACRVYKTKTGLPLTIENTGGIPLKEFSITGVQRARGMLAPCFENCQPNWGGVVGRGPLTLTLGGQWTGVSEACGGSYEMRWLGNPVVLSGAYPLTWLYGNFTIDEQLTVGIPIYPWWGTRILLGNCEWWAFDGIPPAWHKVMAATYNALIVAYTHGDPYANPWAGGSWVLKIVAMHTLTYLNPLYGPFTSRMHDVSFSADLGGATACCRYNPAITEVVNLVGIDPGPGYGTCLFPIQGQIQAASVQF